MRTAKIGPDLRLARPVYLLGFFWRMIQRETDAIYKNDKNDEKFKISVAN